ncbi:hypothetical protein IC762_21535 [Bradyrhizobium genosp. L]|uniref:hypothetical protein n=1 Tax=Bradyrhizobium genosp. L TaxID=83637 RepID=UPI0018A2FCE7|nr:hypothetical protein [Bradyrhizobium genosp. L]QPF82343.1 hypothetical protein IC762_21535 [Bradyrhizobium genosp. L]
MAGQVAVGRDEARIARASQAIQVMSDQLRNELNQAAQPMPLREHVRAFARQAPLPALGIAFLLGVILARR